MIWNNNFLEYDQVGFQKMVYVAVQLMLFRFTRWRTFWVTHPRCTINTPMATPTEMIRTASIWPRHRLFNKWMRILVAVRLLDSSYKTKMALSFPRTLNAEFLAINTWSQVARKEHISVEQVWPYLTQWAGTTWASTTLSPRFGAKIEGAVSTTSTTVYFLNSAAVQASTVIGMSLRWGNATLITSPARAD